MAKKKWLVIVPVERAVGTQTYELEADTLADAKRKWKERGSELECVCEELEVESVGEPEFREDAGS